MAMAIEKITTGFEGIYEVSEAARYLLLDMKHPETRYSIQTRHLIRWIHLGLSHPDLKTVPGKQLLLTFEDLISMRVIAFLRSFNYSFHKIRQAEMVLRTHTNHLRPFATDDIWAAKQGSTDIFGEFAAALLTATRHGQMAFKELLEDNLTRVHGLTFDERGIAETWTPRTGILLHPRIQFGRPCIQGTRIPTNDIVGMIQAGDSVTFLAKSYEIDTEKIEEAVAWEKELAPI